MRFLLDENLSWRLKRVLAEDLGDTLHVSDFAPTPRTDSEIWSLALKENRVILTNDEDFQALSILNGQPPKVILLRIGNQSTTETGRTLISLKEHILLFVQDSEHGVLEIL